MLDRPSTASRLAKRRGTGCRRWSNGAIRAAWRETGLTLGRGSVLALFMTDAPRPPKRHRSTPSRKRREDSAARETTLEWELRILDELGRDGPGHGASAGAAGTDAGGRGPVPGRARRQDDDALTVGRSPPRPRRYQPSLTRGQDNGPATRRPGASHAGVLGPIFERDGLCASWETRVMSIHIPAQPDPASAALGQFCRRGPLPSKSPARTSRSPMPMSRRRGFRETAARPGPRTVRIENARPIAGALSLDVEGVAVVRRPTAVRDFWDEAQTLALGHPETAQLVKDVTGSLARGGVRTTPCVAAPTEPPTARRGLMVRRRRARPRPGPMWTRPSPPASAGARHHGRPGRGPAGRARRDHQCLASHRPCGAGLAPGRGPTHAASSRAIWSART